MSEFEKFTNLIIEKNPLQKKMLDNFFQTRDDVFWSRAETFAATMVNYLKSQDISIEYIVNGYLRMCKDMMKEQFKFKKSGSYSVKTSKEAYEKIYSSEEAMASYMYGLALSYFLWLNHYSMYDFFISESQKLEDVKSYLEVGPGHGLFLVDSILNFPDATFEAIDISPTSTRIAEKIVKYFAPNSKCKFQVLDVNHIQSGNFDYIVMCEVLEHLDNPLSLMKKVHGLLNRNGRCFITTCANAPAIDHVYLYDSVNHIRREIEEAGLEILADLSLPVGDYPEEVWKEEKTEVNYAAMLGKR